jgi:hypothetical protein
MAQYSVNRQAHYNPSNADLHEVMMLSDKDGNIINSFGSASNIPIAAGEVAGYSHINKFGYTGTDHNSTETVWDANGTTSIYPYPAAGTISVAGATSADDGKTIEIQGLDDSYNPVIETLTVGSGTSSATYSRVFRARMVSATNTVLITVNQGGSLAAQILAGNGQTLMAVYTIPAGKTGYLLKFQASMDKQNVDVKFKLFARNFGEAFNLKGQWGTQGGNNVNYDYPVPLVFAEKNRHSSRCRK